MATQRLSNVLSHITPGKSPVEQMYVLTSCPADLHMKTTWWLTKQ